MSDLTSNDTNNLNTVTHGGAVLVDWELYGTRITPDDLRATLRANGYDPAIVPDIDQEQRVRSAGARWTQGRGNADRYRAEVTEDDDAIFVQVLRRANAGTVGAAKAARRKFEPVASLVWQKLVPAQTFVAGAPAVPGYWDADEWFTTAPRSMEVLQALASCRAACDDSRLHHDHEFIRPVLIQAPVRLMGGVPFIRRSGGTMVVPMDSLPELQRLQRLVGCLGDSYMGIVRADTSDAGTVQAMSRSVADDLASRVAAVRSDLAEWRERGTRINTGAVGDRLAQFQQIRAVAQLYAGALSLAVDDLTADITAAEADARALLDVAMGRVPVAPAAAQ